MKAIQGYTSLFISVLILAGSCRKSDKTDILSYNLIGKQADIGIDRVTREVTVTFPESTVSANQVSADFSLSDGATAFISNVIQKPGVTYNNYEVPLTCVVKAENGKNSAQWKIVSVNNSVTRPWGLGDFQQDSRFLNRAYNWYFDQKNSGTFSSINCGPTATTMAARWSDPSYSKTPLDARVAYRPNGGWWYTSTIDSCLNNNGIPHLFYALSTSITGTQAYIKQWIDGGRIVILCLDISYVRDGPRDDRRVDRFYNSSTGAGHFIVVKGYRKVAGSLFFEIYDPWSWGAVYSTGELKGIDRYYRAEDLYTATSIWWNYAIVISQKGAKSGIVEVQDISSFPVAWGR